MFLGLSLKPPPNQAGLQILIQRLLHNSLDSELISYKLCLDRSGQNQSYIPREFYKVPN